MNPAKLNVLVNNRATSLLDRLAGRRKELRMSMKVLAERSGVGMRTVQRVLSQREPNARLNTVLQIADALNVELRFKEAGSAQSIRRKAATKKAALLASMIQGTSALESQAIPKNDLRDIEADIAARLLTGSSRHLWAD